MHKDAFEPQVQDFFSPSASSQCSPTSEYTLLVNQQIEHLFNCCFSHSSRAKYIFMLSISIYQAFTVNEKSFLDKTIFLNNLLSFLFFHIKEKIYKLEMLISPKLLKKQINTHKKKCLRKKVKLQLRHKG